MGRTDAILIAVLDYTRQQIGIISIPRDLWVDAPGLEPGRINTMYRLGDRANGPGKGLHLLKQVIHQELDIEVCHTAMVDFEGFVNIIDYLEGIPVEVACPIEDCFISSELDAGCERLSLTAGLHSLDGQTALKFARSRHGRTDLDRASRQQAVLSGLKRRLTRPAIIPKLPGLWARLSKYISTDIDLETALRMGVLVARVDKKSLHGLVFKPPIVTEKLVPDGRQVLVLDKQRARAAVSDLFSQPMPGTRRRATCPAPDVGLHWRERLKKPAEDKGTSVK